MASHATPGEEFAPANAIDSRLETKWVGEAHPLTLHPTNLVLEFDAPVLVRRVVLVSTVFRDRLALKDFDLYAGVGRGWAGDSPLAVVRGTIVFFFRTDPLPPPSHEDRVITA